MPTKIDISVGTALFFIIAKMEFFMKTAFEMRCENLGLVGAGGFGQVFKVKFKGEVACLKRGRNFKQLKMFLREAKILLQVDGAGGAPKLLAVDSDNPAIMTTFCPGETLSKWMKKESGQVTESELIQLFLQVALSLRDIHN